MSNEAEITANEAHRRTITARDTMKKSAKLVAKDRLADIYKGIREATNNGRFDYAYHVIMDIYVKEVVCDELRSKGFTITQTNSSGIIITWS